MTDLRVKPEDDIKPCKGITQKSKQGNGSGIFPLHYYIFLS